MSLTIAMNPLSSSTVSDVFHVESSSEESSPAQNNTPTVLNSTQLSGAMGRETITISSVASPEPQIVTIDSDSNERTIPYGFANQRPIVPPSLNYLNLLPNPFNVLATMAVIRADEGYSPQSTEPSIPSSFSTPSLNVTTIEGWQTTQRATDDANFILMMSPSESIGIFLRATPLTPMSQEMYLTFQALAPHRRLDEDKKGS